MSPEDPEAQALLEALREGLGSDAVRSAEGERLAYSQDLWPKLTVGMRDGAAPVPPLAILRPRNERDVLRALEILGKYQTAVVPYGAGSGVCGGAAPLFGGVVLDLKQLDDFGPIDSASLQVTVGPGLILQNLEDRLNQEGFTLGHFPSSIYCASIGGCVAARGAGQLSSRYGKIEDMVTGLRVCSPTLELVCTGSLDPRGSQPDWTPLLVGSEGTLAIITAIRLRIHPLPSTMLLRGVRFPSMAAGIEGFRTALQLGLRPSVMRLYDPLDTWMAMQKSNDPDGARPVPGAGNPYAESARNHRPENAAEPISGEPRGSERILGAVPSPGTLLGSAVGRLRNRSRRHRTSHKEGLLDGMKERLLTDRLKALTQPESPALGRLLQQPSLVNKTISLLPGRCLAIVGCEGESKVATQHLNAALAAFRRVGATDLGPEPGEQWYRNRYHVSFKLPKLLGSGGFADTFETAAPWTRIEELYQTVRRAVSPHVLVMAHLSHAYHEGCSIYFTFVGRGASPQQTERLYTRTWDAALKAALRCGATLTHHHGVGFLKREFMNQEHGEARHLFEAARSALAPEQSLNPGKLFPDDIPAAGPPADPEDPMSLRVHAHHDGVVEAGTGWTGAGLAAELSARGHFLPPLGRSFLESKVQDWLASPTLSAHIAVHGAWEYPVLALRGTFPDGRIWTSGRLPRSAAGPNYLPFGAAKADFPTQATSVTLRTLTPPPLRLIGVRFSRFDRASSALQGALQGQLPPLAGQLFGGKDATGYKTLGQKRTTTDGGAVLFLALQEPDGFNAGNDSVLAQLRDAGAEDLGHDEALAWWEDHWAEPARIGEEALATTGPQTNPSEIGRGAAIVGWGKALLLLQAVETLCGGPHFAVGWIESPLETGCTVQWRFHARKKRTSLPELLPHQVEQSLLAYGARSLGVSFEGIEHETSSPDQKHGAQLTRAIADALRSQA